MCHMDLREVLHGVFVSKRDNSRIQGDCNPAMILGAIGGVEAALVAVGIPVGDGGTRRAVMSLADTTR